LRDWEQRDEKGQDKSQADEASRGIEQETNEKHDITKTAGEIRGVLARAYEIAEAKRGNVMIFD